MKEKNTFIPMIMKCLHFGTSSEHILKTSTGNINISYKVVNFSNSSSNVNTTEIVQ
jgi:hypothetical protein